MALVDFQPTIGTLDLLQHGLLRVRMFYDVAGAQLEITRNTSASQLG